MAKPEDSGQREPLEVRYYDSDWHKSKRLYVATALRDAHIHFRWEDSELVVSTADEAFVDGLLREVDALPKKGFWDSLFDWI